MKRESVAAYDIRPGDCFRWLDTNFLARSTRGDTEPGYVQIEADDPKGNRVWCRMPRWETVVRLSV